MKNKQVKVAYIIATLSMGGAEKQLINTLNGLDREKILPMLFVMRSSTKLLDQLSDDVKVYTGNIRHPFDLKSWQSLWVELRRFSPSILHTHLYNGNVVGRFTKLFMKNVKVVNHVHGLGENYSVSRRLLDSWTLKYMDKMIVVSNKSKSLRIKRDKVPSNKVEVIYNSIGIGEDVFFKKKERGQGNKIILGTASRLIKLKNLEAAIFLTKSLNEKGLNVELKIAGEGPEREHLESYTKRLNIESKVTFLGFVKNMLDYYREIDYFVICSTTEDLPLSVIEALSVGKPVIATNVGGIPEMLDGTVHLIGEDFFSSDFIDRVVDFVLETDFSKVYNINKKVAIDKFESNRNTNKLLDVYKELLEI